MRRPAALDAVGVAGELGGHCRGRRPGAREHGAAVDEGAAALVERDGEEAAVLERVVDERVEAPVHGEDGLDEDERAKFNLGRQWVKKNTVVNRDGMPLWQGVSKSVTPSTADTVL